MRSLISLALERRLKELERIESESPDHHTKLYDLAMVLEGEIIGAIKQSRSDLDLVDLHKRILHGVHDRHVDQAFDEKQKEK